MRGLAERRAIGQLAELLESTAPGRGGIPGSAQPDYDVIDPKLAAMLTGVQALGRLPVAAALDADARAQARRRLVAVATVRPAGRPVLAPAAASTPEPPRWRKPAVVAGGAGLAAVLVLTGLGVVSSKAEPGNPLYRIKRETEAARLAIAPSGTDRGRLLLGLAGTRLSEAAHSDSPSQQAATLHTMTMQWTHGFRLLSTAAVRERSTEPLDTADAFLSQQRPAVIQLVGLSPGGIAHAAASGTLRLLDQVQIRVGQLRSTLPCASTAHADALGPLPGQCGPLGPIGGHTPRASASPTPQPTSSGSSSPAPSTPASPDPGSSAGGGVPPSGGTGGGVAPSSGTGGSTAPSGGTGGSTAPSSSTAPSDPPPSSSPEPGSPSPSASPFDPSAGAGDGNASVAPTSGPVDGNAGVAPTSGPVDGTSGAPVDAGPAGSLGVTAGGAATAGPTDSPTPTPTPSADGG